jgi:murein DD-endopeptidase MepM/ murein hydrolase activator NlpD
MVVETLKKARIDKKKVIKHSILWLNLSLISSLFWANSFFSPKQSLNVNLASKNLQKINQDDLLFNKNLSKKIFIEFYYDVQSETNSSSGLAFKKVLNKEAYIAYNLASFSVTENPKKIEYRNSNDAEMKAIRSRNQRTHRYMLASRDFSPALYFSQNKLVNLPAPSYKRISSLYGYRHGQFHKGLDLESSYGSNIVSVLPGFVEFAGWDGAYGKAVIINHGNNIKTLYAHASKINVKVNEWIDAGQVLAQIGTTGDATGPHLHFETIINGVNVNPQKLLKGNLI